jgi:hypothetical protein
MDYRTMFELSLEKELLWRRKIIEWFDNKICESIKITINLWGSEFATNYTRLENLLLYTV